MGLHETLFFYFLIGLGVAAALTLAGGQQPGQRLYQAGTAVLFWPLYLPILLSRPEFREPQQAADAQAADAVPASLDELASSDELAAGIEQVEAELQGALASLDGWAEETLAREQERLAELRAAWRTQANRIREMDRVLAAFTPDGMAAGKAAPPDRAAQCEQARRQNLERLQAVRDQAHEDLLVTLAAVRELVSMIHLAKFTGAPASRADELVRQVAAAVEGLSEVAAWSRDQHAIDS